MKSNKYNLYAVVERYDGSILKQRVCKVDENISQSDISVKLQNYKKILGSGYLIIDWYIDV